MSLDDKEVALHHLRRMSESQRRAHQWASEDGGLTGPLRDMLFGIGSILDALITMVEETS